MTDADRLDWLAQQARVSSTGISFDHVKSVDGEPGGFRFTQRHFIGDVKPDFRTAIDSAKRAMQTVS